MDIESQFLTHDVNLRFVDQEASDKKCRAYFAQEKKRVLDIIFMYDSQSF